MKYYANCPVCAHKLIKGENGTQATFVAHGVRI